MAKNIKNKKTSKFIFWFPRIFTIVFILFLSLFALDIFDMKLGFWGTIVGLFMHLIPSFLLIIGLILAWRNGLIGGIIFIGFGLWYVITMIVNAANSFEFYMISYSFIIAGPAFIIGIMFLIDWKRKR